jgi:hypothetical protein
MESFESGDYDSDVQRFIAEAKYIDKGHKR